MKALKFLSLLIFALFLFSGFESYAGEGISHDSIRGRYLKPEHIVVHPQPLTAGDAVISLNVPGRIITTSIYTITGEKIQKDNHNSSSTVTKYIPFHLKKGEYLLKVYTEDGVGIRRIFIR